MSFRDYFTRKLSVQKSRLSQILPITHLPNAKRLSNVFRHHVQDKNDQSPPKVDLRRDMTAVENQSNIGSSVANCLTGAYEYLTKKSNGCNTDVSRLFIYYNARAKGNDLLSVTDSGCSMTDAIEALEEFGTCLESIWPYDTSKVNIRPSVEAYEQAENHKINKALRVNMDLNEMKSCLAQGFPIAFGLKIYSSFDKAAENGVVSIPTEWEQCQQLNGSHAMLAVGYSDRSDAFIVRNSWGESWGDRGYCYVPYDYITNPNLCFDMWTIRKVANSDFGREYWHFDDVVNYLNTDCTTDAVDENDEECSTDSDEQANRRYRYYHRKSLVDDSWEEYRHYEENPFTKRHEEYVDNRHRRDRYDRDNEPYDHHLGVPTFRSSRSSSSSIYDRHQEESNYYAYSNDDYYTDHQRRSMF